MHKVIIKSSKLNDINIDSIVYNYYINLDRNKFNPGTIGPIIKGIDVGNARYSDTHLNYPLIDLTTTKIIIKDYKCDEYSVRLYYPENIIGLRPAVFYIHGGGFIFGNVQKCDMPMKRLAELINGVVVSIDYSLSPEVAYPFALEQCYKCFDNMLKNSIKYNIDSKKVFVMGDSAGGNLAAALCLKDKKDKRIRAQILLYPELDLSRTFAKIIDKKMFGDSIDEYAWCKILNTISKLDTWDKAYLQHNENRREELISPFFAANMSDFPDTLLFCAQYDYFTLEGEEFAKKLDDARVNVRYYCFEGCFHGFLERLGILEQSDIFIKTVAEYINKL